MSRNLRIAGAQLGPIQRDADRAATLARLIALMEAAAAEGAELVVFPELALTTFFPRYYMTDQKEVDTWFEAEMPGEATKPLFEAAMPSPRIALSVTPCPRAARNQRNPPSNAAIEPSA